MSCAFDWDFTIPTKKILTKSGFDYSLCKSSFPVSVKEYFIEKMNENGYIGRSFDFEKIQEALIDFLYLSANKHLIKIETLTKLDNINKEFSLEMPSFVVDELWHVFMLHNKEYKEYCKKCFGCEIYHHPKYISKEQIVNYNKNKDNRSYSLNMLKSFSVYSYFYNSKEPSIFMIDREMFKNINALSELGWAYYTNDFIVMSYLISRIIENKFDKDNKVVKKEDTYFVSNNNSQDDSLMFLSLSLEALKSDVNKLKNDTHDIGVSLSDSNSKSETSTSTSKSSCSSSSSNSSCSSSSSGSSCGSSCGS